MPLTIAEYLEGQGRAFGDILTHPDFSYFYCRFYNGEFIFANIVAHHPGAGAFTRCLEYLSDKQTVKIVTVECVETDRFIKKLQRLGFVLKPKSHRTYWRVNHGYLQQSES